MTYPSVTKTILIGKESVWGTPVSPTKDIGLVTDISTNLSREVIESMSMGAIDVQQIDGGIFDPGINVTVEYQHGRLLEYILGSVAHAETTGDWKHTFTISNTAPSFTLEDGNNLTTDTVLTAAGLLVESGEISFALNEKLKMIVGAKGKTITSSATASAAVISSLPVFPHALIHTSINGVEATEVQNFAITVTKVVSRSGGGASNLYQQGHAVELHIEFSGTLGFANKTFQELYLGGTTPAATANPAVYDILLNAHNGVALGSGRRELYLELENCIATTFDESATIGNLVFIDIAGKGTLKSCFSVDNISSANW